MEYRFLSHVIEIQPNRVIQIKTKERDGYESVQVTTGKKSSSRLNKPEAGHFAKANVEPGKGLWEFQLDDEDSEFIKDLSLGKEITVDKLFKLGAVGRCNRDLIKVKDLPG